MTAIVTGKGLGLQRTSVDLLGSRAQLGSAGLGRAPQGVTVNAGTGSLVIQTQDEILVGRGPDAMFNSTYNSLGALNNNYTNLDGTADADGWLLSTQRKLVLSGTANTAGSTATLTDWDGTQVVFAWNGTSYATTDQGYSDDTVSLAAGIFTYTEGKSRVVQTFAQGIGGRIIDMKDADGNTVTYTYTGNTTTDKLTRVTTANSTATQFNYTDLVYGLNSGGNTQITLTTSYSDLSVTPTPINKTLSRVVYIYDSALASARLRKVQVDLTPLNGADASSYSTTYTYKDATSKLITGIAQSDGTSYTIAYDTANKVSLLTQTMASGVSQTTAFAYAPDPADTTRTITTITINSATLNYVYKMTTDAQGRLTRLEEPALTGGASSVKTFTYATVNTNQVLVTARTFGSTADEANAALAIETDSSLFDANFNLLERVLGDNSAVKYTYGTLNQLLTEAHYTGFDADGVANGVAPAGAMLTQYIYDEAGNGVGDDGTAVDDVAEKHLRFTVSAEGRVTEYKYNGFGQLTATLVYTGSKYTGAFTEAALNTWSGTANDLPVQRTDNVYDFRGNLSQSKSYSATDTNGAGITAQDYTQVDYIYDMAGRLLSRKVSGTNALGEPATPVAETFVYDGLGRVISSTDLRGQTTTISIDDLTRITTISTPNDPTRTLTYNIDGSLQSEAVSSGGTPLGTTSYAYDAIGRLRMATDAVGVKTYYTYDRQSRLSATIDGNGTMTEYKYDGADRVVATVTYANAVSAANLITLGTVTTNTEAQTVRPAVSTSDRWSWTIYNKAGRVVQTIDASGAVTKFDYDGAGRLVSTYAYWAVVAAATLNGADGVSGYRTSLPTTSAVPATNVWTDRTSQNFYDNDGVLVGTVLQLVGYSYGKFVEYVYDAAGQLIDTVTYANSLPPANWQGKTFAQIKTAVVPDTTNDAHSYRLYDGRGRLGAAIDGEGNVTRYHYTARGDLDQQIVGQKVTASTSYTLATLPAASGTLEYTRWYRDSAGAVTSQVRTLTGGTETTAYTYDTRGRLLTQTVSETVSTETRTQTLRYDSKGRLASQLSGEGSAALAALGASPTQAQIDTVYATYGTTYSYDLADRLIAKVTPDGSGAGGVKTLYYYDGDGNLRFEINALGEVVEHQFNNFEQESATIVHGARIAPGTLTTLTGGLVTAAVTTAVSGLGNPSSVQFGYDTRGLLSSRTDELGNVTTFTNNPYGQTASISGPVLTGPNLPYQKSLSYYSDGRFWYATENSISGISGGILGDVYSYDSPTPDGLMTQHTLNSTDQRVVRSYTDRAGRVTKQRDALYNPASFVYDARSNVISSTDRTNKTANFSYDLFNRNVTTTTAEGITSSVKQNAYGQTIQITDGKNQTTTYTYDKDGNLKTVVDAAGTTTYSYDKAGRVVDVIDAKNAATHYTYDAVGRVLTEVRDYGSGKLNLTTTYSYDAKGQAFSVTDAAGVVTQFTFNAKGQKTRVVQDAGSGKLNLTTDFIYRADGKVISQTDAVGTAQARTTTFEYDTWGRLTKKIEDAGSGKLNVTTQYYYDLNNNLIASTDALGRTTRFVYDISNRLTLTINAEGQVAQTFYDAEDRAIATRQFVGTLSAAQVAALADVTSGLQWNEVSTAGNGDLTLTKKVKDATTGTLTTTTAATLAAGSTDRISRAFYDGDGRAVYAVDAEGYVTQNVYDKANNVIQTIRYALQTTTLTNSSTTAQVAALFSTTIPTAGLPATNIPATAVVMSYAYDGANRPVYAVDGEGFVTQSVYDKLGNVIQTIRYTNQVTLPAGWTTSTIAGLFSTTIPTAGLPATNIPTSAVVTSYAYDNAARLTDVTDGEGNVTHFVMDALGQITDTTVAYGTSDAVTTHRVFDNLGRVTQETRAYGAAEASTTNYTYDILGSLLSVVSAAGKPEASTTNFTYDALGRVLTQSVDLGKIGEALTFATTTFAYDALGNKVKVTDPRGNSGYFYYDKLGRLTLQVDPEGYVVKTEYGLNSEVAKVTRYANAATNQASISATVLPTWTANAATDAVTEFTYDKVGRVKTAKDAELFTESYSYDGLGNRTSVTNKLGGVTSYGYDKRGLLTSETRNQSVYDYAGTLVLSQVVTTYSYDSRGNLVQKFEGSNIPASGTNITYGRLITAYEYDKLDRLTKQTDPAFMGQTPVTQWQYDRRGNVVLQTAADGGKTYSYYDRNNRKIAEINPVLTQTAWAYDGNGNVTSQKVYSGQAAAPTAAGGTAAAGIGTFRETQLSYDRSNRLVQTSVIGVRTGAYNGTAYATSAGQNLNSYNQYDAAGNLIKETDANGNAIYHWYDKRGKEVAKVDQEGYLTTWTRDADGNVLWDQRYATKVAGTPNPLGASPGVAASADDRHTSFTYDKMGRRLTETRHNVAMATVGAAGALTIGTGAANIVYTYNGLGEVKSKVEATGDKIEYQYDNQGRLERQLDAVTLDVGTNGTAQVRHVSYFYYDANNNLARTVERAEAGTSVGGAAGTVGTYAAGYSASDDRVNMFGYNGNKLQWTQDPLGNQRNSWYDIMGRKTHDYYQRANSAGVVDTVNANFEGSLTSYDAAGRVVSQWQATQTNTGVWNTQGPVTQFTYNTYGEVTTRVVGGYTQESFSYDNAGRVVKTTGGDGVAKFVVYDANGNATLMIQSNGKDLTGDSVDSVLTYIGAIDTMSVTDVVATVTTYDKRNMALATREPSRTIANSADVALTTTATLVRSRSYTAFGEVASETDARGNTTNYAYNTMGRLTQKMAPTVNVTDEAGNTAALRPTENYAYDVSGRAVGSQNANGFWTTRTLQAGTGYGGSEAVALKEFRPDNSVWEARFNAFGNTVETYDGLGRKTTNVFDKANRLVQVTKPSGLIESFAYDVLGQRVAHWNNVFQTPIYGAGVWVESGYWDYGYNNNYYEPNWIDTSHWEYPVIGYTPYKETTDYDVQGRVTKQVNFAGDQTTYTYSWTAVANTALGLTGGWTKAGSYANGHTTSETTDFFGRMLSRTDMGGHVYTYTYNRAGQLASQTSTAGQSIGYTYFNTGRVAAMNDNSAAISGYSNANIDATYTYDADGNRTYEKLAGTYYYYYYGGYAGSYTQTMQEGRGTYDALNRLLTFTDPGTSGNGGASITNSYDAAGNVRRTVATHATYTANQALGANVTEDYWYKYDSLNRMTTVKGVLLNGAITTTTAQGLEITYNLASERATQSRKVYVQSGYYGYESTSQEVYTYNADGLVATVSINQGYGNLLRAQNTYDLLGRVTDYREFATDGTTVQFNRYGIGYDYRNAVLYETTSLRRVESDNILYVTVASVTNNYLAGGVLNSVTSGNYRMKYGTTYNETPDTFTQYSYTWWDSAQQAGVSFDSDTGSATNTIFTNQFQYDVNGHLTSVNISDGRPRNVTYITDASGQIIKRTEADNIAYNASTQKGGDPIQAWWFFDGKQVGTTGNNGNDDPEYETALTERVATPGTATNTPFRMSSEFASQYSDFDQAYNSLSPGEGGGAGFAYTVRGGDTLEGIAQAIYGDSSLWYLIADANSLGASSQLVAGQVLRVPSNLANVHNTSSTFRTYDQGRGIGDVQPTTPQPPKNSSNKKCGVFGSIMRWIISTVVSTFFKVVLAPLYGVPIIGKAIVNGISNVVSQGISTLVGLQDHIDWKEIGRSFVSDLVSGFFDYAKLGGKTLVGRAISKATQSAVSQGINIATGLQDKMSWGAVASAGVTSIVGDKLHIGGKFGSDLSKIATRIAGIATESLIDGTDFGDNLVAGLPGFLDDTIGDNVENFVTRVTKSLIAKLNPKPAENVSNPSGSIPIMYFVDPRLNGLPDPFPWFNFGGGPVGPLFGNASAVVIKPLDFSQFKTADEAIAASQAQLDAAKARGTPLQGTEYDALALNTHGIAMMASQTSDQGGLRNFYSSVETVVGFDPSGIDSFGKSLSTQVPSADFDVTLDFIDAGQSFKDSRGDSIFGSGEKIGYSFISNTKGRDSADRWLLREVSPGLWHPITNWGDITDPAQRAAALSARASDWKNLTTENIFKPHFVYDLDKKGKVNPKRPYMIKDIELNKDQYDAAVRIGVFKLLRTPHNLKVKVNGQWTNATFNTTGQSSTAGSLASADAATMLANAKLRGKLPSGYYLDDTPIDSDMRVFATSIGEETYRAQTGDKNQDHEKFLSLEYRMVGSRKVPVVARISLVGTTGGYGGYARSPNAVAILHTHQAKAGPAPFTGDPSVPWNRNIPNFVVGNDSGTRVMTEITRKNDQVVFTKLDMNGRVVKSETIQWGTIPGNRTIPGDPAINNNSKDYVP